LEKLFNKWYSEEKEGMVNSKKVHLLGAFDRFNYGDLLFPIIFKNRLKGCGDAVDSDVYGLVESNLSQYGALKTESIRVLYTNEKLNAGDTVVFAGGGTIGVDWSYMYSNLLGHTGNKILYYSARLFGAGILDGLCKLRLGGRSSFPWMAKPEEFSVDVNVAYNAVGGSEFEKLPKEIQYKKLDILKDATYLSVRDAKTKQLFSPIENSVSIELAPDSAILMSEQYPLRILRTLSSPSVLNEIDGKRYICFQCNLDYNRSHQDKIIDSLEKMYEKYGLQAVLLPIGRYAGLDDQIALREIKAKIRTPSAIISDQASIFEIMLTIAQSKLFVGTSLHGNVTAQSFAVPHLGLSDRPCKVDYYLSTWDLPEQSRCAQVGELVEMAGVALSVDDLRRQEKRSELISLSHSNFSKMFEKCRIC
jgi:hypothetical protein